MEKIVQIHSQSKGSYGSPRVHRELVRSGYACNRKSVARLMHQSGITGAGKHRRGSTTKGCASHLIAENLLKQNFVAHEPNKVWLTDTTYIGTKEGWLYLTTVLEMFSRRIVGWAFSERNSQAMVQSALTMAISTRKPAKGQGLILHSDRGSPFTAHKTATLLQDNGILQSMSRVGNPYDNAPAESFFASLKKEAVGNHIYQSRAQAQAALFEYIEVFYNRRRLHSSIGYCPPVEFEQNFLRNQLIPSP